MIPLLLWLVGCAAPVRTPSDTDGVDTAQDTGTPEDTGASGHRSALADAFGAALTEAGGCGDVMLYASDLDETVLLAFKADGAATAAYDADGGIAFVWAFPLHGPVSDDDDEEEAAPVVAAPELLVQQGHALAARLCDDAPVESPVVTRAWMPVTGAAVLSIEPTGERNEWGDVPARATLTLTDMAFVPTDAPESAPVPMGDLTFEARVGWLPG